MAEGVWRGVDAAVAKLRSLDPKRQRSTIYGINRRAMKIVQAAAQAGARLIDDPETQASIAANIAIRQGSKKDQRKYGTAFVTKVGVIGGAAPKPGREDSGHWRFFEFGTRSIRARPFMRPAMDNNVDRVIAFYTADMGKAIDRAMKRQLKAAQ